MTHPSSVKYGALSVLGAFSLAATILATLYTTAANALVLPQLKYGNWEAKPMQGLVRSSFGNVQYIKSNCKTPISDQVEQHSSLDCFQVQNAGQSFLNYQRYLAIWTTLNENSNSTTDPYKRPPGFGLMYENTTITAPWIDIQPPLNEDGRIITNSSLAYPHAGVYQAARDPTNGILQPQELDGLGLYGVRAAVASPVMNVLCIQTPKKADLDPLVYETWPAAGNFSQFNSTIWPAQIANVTSSNFNNATALDKYFRWGNTTEGLLARPIFARYPIKYDTLLNHTQAGYGRDAIYLLGRRIDEYVICELSASLTPNCATDYNATASSGSMEAVCSNKTYSDIPRDRNVDIDGDAIQGLSTRSKDWFEVAGEWGKSLALHTGISEGRGSNSRILMNLLLTPPEPGLPQRLKRATPSISEALAVMAGSTLMYSSLDAPFNTRQWVNTPGIISFRRKLLTHHLERELHIQYPGSSSARNIQSMGPRTRIRLRRHRRQIESFPPHPVPRLRLQRPYARLLPLPARPCHRLQRASQSLRPRPQQSAFPSTRRQLRRGTTWRSVQSQLVLPAGERPSVHGEWGRTGGVYPWRDKDALC